MHSRLVKRFKPCGEINRISEGDFIRLKDGRILFACSCFRGGTGDDMRAEVAGWISSDEGETWGGMRVLLSPETLRVNNVMSVNFLRMENGDIGLFVVAKPDDRIYRIVLVRSCDEGMHFDRVTDCQKNMAVGQYVLNNSRVIRLKTGRILLPLAYHRVNVLPDGKAYKDGRAVAVFIYSDDDGETWTESPDTLAMPFPLSRSGLQEPGVLERADGTLYAYFRTDLHAQWEAYSFDRGLHWTAPQPSRFTSPLSPMKLARDSKGRIVAVWNPVPNYNGRDITSAGWGRTPLVTAWSEDDGKTWTEMEIVEDEPGHGYCYPAVFFTRDGMLMSYCSGGPDEGSCLAETTIRKWVW